MIVTLTGAFRNVGDHLIGHRASILLKKYFDPEVVNITRSEIREADYETMNRARAVFMCGGPAYQKNIYPNIYPLDLNKLETAVIPLGLGWKGAVDDSPKDFQFSEESLAFIKSVHESIPSGSCRDYLTVEVLENFGVHNVVMTGCPAWYDLESMEREFEVSIPHRIVVSDPAYVSTHTIQTMRYLRNRFPNSDIALALHHGYYSSFNRKGALFGVQHLGLAALARSLRFTVHNISANLDAMRAVYENCDLHVGYRVHAHIYNLSRRTPSLLISEDSRGVGQSKALECTVLESQDAELIKKLDDEIELLMTKKGAYFLGSLRAMREGFTTMQQFLQSIE
jgi:hypothetical protein